MSMEERATQRGVAAQLAIEEHARPETGRINGLDGLRAIAVLAVLVYHLYAGLLPGGFLGVDVFFVVSGFLITTLLLREVFTTGRISLGQFWLRRARRLLPALLVVILISTALGFLIGRDLLVGIGRQTLGAMTFSNNWLEIAAGSSYFAHTAPQLFVNFWSLAVEEQFYLLWPFGFLVLIRYVSSRRRRLAVAAGCALASALLMAVLYTPGTDATRVYYGTDTHAFGLLIGVALAFAWSGGTGMDLSRPNWRHRRKFIGLGALALLIGCMYFLDAASPFVYRGGILLVCVFTAVLILTLLEGAGPLQSMLNFPVLTWVGQRSYGIYLWHWPALVISDAVAPQAIGTPGWWSIRIIALALTVLVSALSFRYLEQPVRRKGFRATWAAAAGAVARGGINFTGAKLAAGLGAALALLAIAGILTAPAQSQVQTALERNQSIVSAATPVIVTPSSAASPTADQPSAPVSAPVPSPVPVPTAGNAPTPATPSGTPMGYPAGEEVIAIGDSLVVTSADGLRDRFPGMAFDAVSNRQWPDGVAAIGTRVANGSMRRAVIVHFGTNAGVDQAMVSKALDLLGRDRMVVLVNLYGASSWVPSANDALANAVKGRPNVIIADWNKAISQRPDLLQPDQIHPGIFGAHLYADTIKRAFHDLAVRTGGTVPGDYTIVDDY
ncbi:acyltransferase family protein [Arthrobacter sp. H14-L1]|uniref:acyltransferase family protein n=1 Tax=Arthrobacter sp. H14-L1 TaxID=2996697 RepID=UPI00226E89F3|nr:acyltransferase family protein [Arthrobacter sp. H14-L1]MCY0903944.1 acyltransferase family protein [Arthrobacter sp. H14-L1]